MVEWQNCTAKMQRGMRSGNCHLASSKRRWSICEKKLAETGVEALVLDTIYFFLELAPMRLGMPYAHIWNVLHLDFSGATPNSLFSWPYETTPEALIRNVE
jgi:hypothetical protein